MIKNKLDQFISLVSIALIIPNNMLLTTTLQHGLHEHIKQVE